KLADTGLPLRSTEDIRGGTKEENAETMRRIFGGEAGPIRDIVLLNSAGVLLAGDRVDTIEQGIQTAAEIIDDGAALEKLEDLAALSQNLE
ncbi:MAG: anthranilate phosphoribosyltransferase, partial [Chloroflexi bacterium]|nr:anthranilate phosphoribosyltransferase [Chloroflexota bacterium]